MRVTKSRSQARHPGTAVTLAAVAALLLAACGGGSSGAGVASAPSTAAAPPANVFPLTGVPIDDPAKAARPAIIVKVENEPPARPQAGLEHADVVYEQLIEGGDTRFLAIYHSTDADSIGSIRSIRPTDPEIVDPIGGLFAYSGGTPKFVAQLHATSVVDVGRSTHEDAYFIRSDRAADHKLFSSTPRLYAAGAGSPAKPPPPLFSFLPAGSSFGGAGVAPASHVETVVGNQKITYDFDPARGWLRSLNGRPHVVQGGEQLAPDNVIVQSVDWVPSDGDFDTLGSPVSVAQLVGSGDALIASDGKVVRAKWSKANAAAVTTYTGTDGKPIALKPGQTWVELAGNDKQPIVR